MAPSVDRRVLAVGRGDADTLSVLAESTGQQLVLHINKSVMGSDAASSELFSILERQFRGRVVTRG